MNCRRWALWLAVMAAASLACNFLVPAPTPLPTPGGGAAPGTAPTASAAPGTTPAAGTPAEGAVTPGPAGTPNAATTEATTPRILGHAPEPGEAWLPGGAIEIYFDQAMDAASAETAFTITPALLGRFSWPDSRTLRFEPTQLSQPNERYAVTVGTTARSQGGPALAEPATFEVQTADLLKVVRVFPAGGSTEVPADSPITVMFNRPVMAEGAGAPQPLALSPSVKGQGQWLDAATYQFLPAAGALPAGTQYSARIGRTLTATGGVSLAADYAWQFSTKAPTVTRLWPAAGASALPVTTTVSLSFSQPMDTASVGAALEFRAGEGGAWPGRLTWNEANTDVTFTPDTPWPKAALIEVRLAASAAAPGGLKLSTMYAWSLSTVAPAIVDSQPAAEAVDVPLTASVALTFSQPMDRSTTERAFSLMVNNDRLGGRVGWSDDNTRLIFTPDARLPYGTRLTASLDQTARAADGTSTVIRLTRAFTTVATPAVQSTWPPAGTENTGYGEGSFKVTFVSPMEAKSLAQNIVVEPKPAKVTLVNEARTATLSWLFAPDTKYTVTMKAALADVYGTPIGKETVVSFHTAPLSQALELYPRSRFGVYSARLPTKLYVFYCTAPALELSLYRLKFKDLTDLSPANLTLLRRWKQTLPAKGDGLAEVYLDAAQNALLPGLYYIQVGVSGGPAAATRDQMMVVADSNLTLKVAGGEALVWATAYDTGQPIAGRAVQIFDKALNAVGNGVTDARGLFRLTLPEAAARPGVYYALTDDRTFGGYALAASDWTLAAPQAPVEPYLVYLYTERPAYHPGQTVHVRGIVREEEDARYRVPQAAKPVTLTLPGQSALGAVSVTPNAFGTLEAEFGLPKDAVPGDYVVRANGAGLNGETTFRVEPAPMADFVATASAGQAGGFISDTVRLTVQAQSFEGAAMPEVRVDWEVTGTVHLRGTGVTDTLGRFAQPITPTASGPLVFMAHLTDAEGRRATAQTRVEIHPARVNLTATLDRHIGMAGQASGIQVLARDWDGQPIPNQAVEAAFQRQVWRDGVRQWVKVGRTLLTTDRTGLAAVPFYPPSDGLYEILVTAQDEAGRVATAEAELYAIPAPGTPVGAGAPPTISVQLMADQRQYRPGDVAEILITSPYAEAVRGLITVERGRILFADVITVTSAGLVYSLPVAEAYAPNVFVNVALMRGARGGDARPTFTAAQLNLPVAAERQALRVQLTVDKPQALPGDTVTVALMAADALNRPVSAEFSVSLTDLAHTPAAQGLSDFFYGPHPLGVSTGLGLRVSADLAAPPAYRLPCQLAGAGLGEGGGAAAQESSSPATVPLVAAGDGQADTAFWQAAVTTGPDGRAQVTVKLPASAADWQVEARGVTTDTLAGQATAEVKVRRPLVIEPIAPRFLVAGDQAVLGAVISNNTTTVITAQVALTSTGVMLGAPARQLVSILPMGQVRVEWVATVDASPSGPSSAELGFSVQGAGYADSSQPATQRVPVYRYRAPEVEAVSGELDQAGSRTEGMAAPHRYPDAAAQLEVAVSPSLSAALVAGLIEQERLTMPGNEALASAFLPGVHAYRASLPSWASAAEQRAGPLAELVRRAARQLAQSQNDDGGWGWQAGDATEENLTAYMVLGLQEAKAAGLLPPESDFLLTRGVDYLRGQISHPLPVEISLETRAFEAYAVSLSGGLSADVPMALYGRRAEMSDAGLAFTALALAQAKPGAAEIQTLLSELRSRARTLPEGAGTRWAEPLPTTAIVLQALAQLEPANPLLPEGIRWLMGARQPAGGWRSGYYSAWALMAVTDWLKADPAAAGQATYGFSAELNGNALTATTTLLDTTWYTAPAGPVNTLSVGREAGAGTLYYSARLAVYPEIGKLPALDRGLMISREYLKPSAGCGGKGQAPCPSVSEARVGETLLVKLTLIVPSDTAYVQVEDYLPAGAEILELPDASGLVPSTLAYVPEAEAGRFRAVASADRLTLLALRLPAGVYSYTYQIAPRVAGRYAARPTLAQAAYAPEIYGRAAGSVLTVKP